MARNKGAGAPPSEEAARRQADREAARVLREAEALRANLQRRKAQARERAAAPPGAEASASDDVDDGVHERQRNDSA